MGRAHTGNDADSDRHRAPLHPLHSPERRHSFRVQIPAHAGVWHKGQLCGYYAVRDLSIGGCLLAGGGKERIVGDHVELLLHLPHHNSVGVTGVVRRVDEHAMGLSFEHATPRAEDCIQELVVEAFAMLRAHADGRVALVIEPNEAHRRRLVEQLAGIGQVAVGVATPLDAVQVLTQEGERVDFAFIEAESIKLSTLELVEFLIQQHPRVRRVLIGDGDELGQHWLAEASGEVHGMLELPCTNEAAQRVLARVRGLSASQLS